MAAAVASGRRVVYVTDGMQAWRAAVGGHVS